MLTFVSEEINRYCEAHSSLPSPIAAELEKYTVEKVERSIMLTGSLVGSFLGFMVSLTKAKRVVEVGTYTGYSALCMAERLPKDGELITFDINPETTRIGKTYWDKSPHGKKIRSVIGPAVEGLKSLSGEIDLAFIDADKPNYIHYLKAILPKLSSRGVVLADNCLWAGRVLDPKTTDLETKAIQEFNRFVHESPELESHLLPLRDGIHLIRKTTGQ